MGILATILLAPTVSAASPGSARLTDSTYPSRFVAGQSGGTAIVADWQEPSSFNPYYQYQVAEVDVTTATEAGLVTVTDDLRYLPDQATRVPTVANGDVVIATDGSATVTWRLRAGLHWSDGTPLGCADYAFTAGWIVKAGNHGIVDRSGYLTRAGLAHYGQTGQVRARDINLTVACPTARRMVWRLKEQVADYLGLLPHPLPKHHMAGIPIAKAVQGAGYRPDQLASVPVSGPFRFDSFTPGVELRLSRNPEYIDRLTGGPAYLAHLVFAFYSDSASMIDAYKGASPAFDVAKDLSGGDWTSVKGLDDVVRIPSSTYETLMLNWASGHCSVAWQPKRGGACPISSLAMRDALSHAIDRDAINVDVLGGGAEVTGSPVVPGAWFEAATPARTRDLAKARQVLSDAGWVLDEARDVRFRDLNGNGRKDGTEYDAVLEACTTSRQVRLDTLALVAESLARVGIRLKIRSADSLDLYGSWNEATNKTPCNLSRGNYDMVIFAQGSDPLDTGAFYDSFHSSQFPPGGWNDARVKDAVVDSSTTVAARSMDVDKVAAAMTRFQSRFRSRTVQLPLYRYTSLHLVDPDLANFTGGASEAGPMWNVQHWWFDR